MDFYGKQNFNSFQVKNAAVHNGPAIPSLTASLMGQLFFKTSNQLLYMRRKSDWKEFAMGLNSQFPSGIILMWNKANEVPEGFVICDGNNGTPNILDKFIKATPTCTTTAGTTSDGFHAHSYISHGHTYVDSVGSANYGGEGYLQEGGGATAPAGTHHTHSLGGVLADSSGETSLEENYPAYKEIIFIMKT